MSKKARFALCCPMVTIFICLIVFCGCSIKAGGIDTQTHFSYPNSNVTPLGPVSSSFSKTGIIFPPSVTGADVKGLMDKALAQKAGADLVINSKIDTKYTIYPLFFFNIYTVDMTLAGTAANMEVGIQELDENLKKFGY